MSSRTRLRLQFMMFVQYLTWGSWFITLGTYMSKTLEFDAMIGIAYGAQGIAAILATLVVGTIADRYLPAERLMGALAILAGATLLWLSSIEASAAVFLGGILLHLSLFMPTLPLANSIALGTMPDPTRQFPQVRLFGTLGWIVAGFGVAALDSLLPAAPPMRVAGVLGILFGLYSFTLPHTAPRGKVPARTLISTTGLDLFINVREREFWVFIAASVFMMIPVSFYNAYCNNFLHETGLATRLVGFQLAPTAVQTLGQVTELLFLGMLPFILPRLGFKRVMVLAMSLWSLRCVLLSLGFDGREPDAPLLLAAVLLHGVCYDFMAVGSQLYVNGRFDKSARSRAQAFLTVMTMGVGALVGSYLANAVYRANTISNAVHDWRTIWLFPAAAALICAVGFGWLFAKRSSSRIFAV